MEKLIIEDSPQFNEHTIENLKTTTIVYHSDEDTFFIRPETPQPAVSFDIGGELWIRYDPNTKDVIGIEIENFETVFLKKHPEIAKIWKTVKPHCDSKKTRVTDDEICESFLQVLVSFFKELFQNRTQQTCFDIT